MYARFSFLLGLVLASQVAFAGFLKSAEERLKEDAEKFPEKALLAEFYPQDESLQRYKLQISGESLLLSQGEYAGRIEPNFATKGFTQYSIILTGDAVRRVEDKVPASLLTDFKYPN